MKLISSDWWRRVGTGHRGWWAVPTLIFACATLFLYRLGHRELTSSHEARAAQNAVSIVNDGHWALPRLLDQRIELQKPPLYYWLVALTAWLQGGVVDAWAVRLPTALSALGCVLAVVGTLWFRGRPIAGLLAGAILATFVHFTWLARTGRIDMPLTLAVTLTLCGFYLARCPGDSTRRWMLLGYIAIALGVLLKGPIAVVLALIVVVPTWLMGGWRQERSTLRWGVPLVALLAVPWFLWANIKTDGRFFDVFFWHHNVERGLGGSELASHPWWYYFPRVAVDLLPWSLVLPLAAVFVWKHRDDADARFGAVWMIAILGFLSLMRFKRADYLLPAYPGAALLLGCYLERVVVERPALRAGLIAGVVVSFAGWMSYIQWFEPTRNTGAVQRQLAQEIRSRTSFPVIFFRVEDHALAFHVGRPLDTIMEWENLEWWATQPVPICIVMPPDCAAEWPARLLHGELRELRRTSGTSDSRPMVLFESVVPKGSRP